MYLFLIITFIVPYYDNFIIYNLYKLLKIIIRLYKLYVELMTFVYKRLKLFLHKLNSKTKIA